MLSPLFVKFHINMLHLDKVQQLCDRLDLPYYGGAGLLALLWAWVREQGDCGDITGISPRTLARAVNWDGAAEDLLDALIETGWIDREGETLVLHHYDEINRKSIAEQHSLEVGQSLHQPQHKATVAAIKERDGNWCRFCDLAVDFSDRRSQKPSRGRYVKLDPRGNLSASNVVVCCNDCMHAHGGKTLEGSGLALTEARGQKSLIVVGNQPLINPETETETETETDSISVLVNAREHTHEDARVREGDADEARRIARVLGLAPSEESIRILAQVAAEHPDTDAEAVARSYDQWQSKLPIGHSNKHHDRLAGFARNLAYQHSRGKFRRRALSVVPSAELELPPSGSKTWDAALELLAAGNADAVRMARRDGKISLFERVFLPLQVVAEQGNALILGAETDELVRALQKQDGAVRSALRAAGYEQVVPRYIVLERSEAC